LPG
ncbi:hypothetical protein D046_8198B, partial [Vibrio parahaemolyticus V-223/04]|jgi:subfamily B ATP-binding cassette protein HlyB/CyaB